MLIPKIDGARLELLLEDNEPLERVVLESDALDVLLRDARTLTSRHFEAMGTRELDADGIDGILADPSASRGLPYMARGAVDALRTRRRNSSGEVEYIGRLRLEDDSMCYFLVVDAPETIADQGGFVRVDGLFLKVYSDEDTLHPGEWIEAPLLVGPRAQRSYRSLGEVVEPHWGLYQKLQDADLSPRDGSPPRIVRETPFEPLWYMMAFARDLAPETIDWATTPELDHELMLQLMEAPEEWRAQPVRIPISRIQDARVKRAGENPARIERYTEGWIGNWNWPNVAHFMSPVADFDLQLRDYAYGNGFFLHNFAYDSAGRSLRVAPMLVLTSLTRFENRKDPLWGQLSLTFGILGVLLVVLFIFLLMRDQQRSRTLTAEIVRRRRARLARRGQPITPAS